MEFPGTFMVPFSEPSEISVPRLKQPVLPSLNQMLWFTQIPVTPCHNYLYIHSPKDDRFLLLLQLSYISLKFSRLRFF